MANAYKPYVLTLEKDQIEWIKKGAKDFKVPTTEFMRTLIDHMMELDLKDFKKELTKNRIQSMLKEAQKKAAEYATQKESLEQELEKLNA